MQKTDTHHLQFDLVTWIKKGRSFLTFGISVVLQLLFFAAVPARPALAVEIVNIDFEFAITCDFKEPSDVAVSKDGKIYVVDGVNSKIKVFKPDGKALTAFGEPGDGKGQFRYPLGIDVDNAGNIYIADSGNHRVQIFDKNHVFTAMITLSPKNGRPADPTDVAVDESRNRLYVVDNDHHHFLVYDLSTLKLTNTVGEPGEQDLMFRYPFFIALNQEQYVYIVDVINTRVQVINPDGLFVTAIGGWGVEKGQFFRPKGVAVDTANRIYVSDSYMGVIQVFDTWGEFRGVLGDGAGEAIQRFKTPTGIYIDDHNRLYVVEMAAQKVSVYRIEAGK